MTSFFGSAFWLLVTLGVLVTFHEFGHYWVARRCGVKVLRFSVGFGNAIWKRIGRDGTEYRIAAIPLGGYVKMLDAREGDVDPALADQEFTGKPVWKRIAIVAAGPGFNLIFTVAALWLMFMLGRPDVAPVVVASPHSLAADAGVRPGDRIISIDSSEVASWSDALDSLGYALFGRHATSMTVEGKDGSRRQLTLPLDRLPPGQSVDQYMDRLGLDLTPLPPVIDSVTPDQPASEAGMHAGDRIVSVNGQGVDSYEDFTRLVKKQAAISPKLTVVVQRQGKDVPLSITARHESLEGSEVAWFIGAKGLGHRRTVVHYGPLRALRASLQTTWSSATHTLGMIGQMLSGRASANNLSGVIGIAQVANSSAQMGLPWFLNFLATVSLSLAILNLLPIPLLDGGHLLYYLVELVKGSPVSEQVMIVGQYIGLALLFTLMGLAFYNDIHRTLFT